MSEKAATLVEHAFSHGSSKAFSALHNHIQNPRDRHVEHSGAIENLLKTYTHSADVCMLPSRVSASEAKSSIIKTTADIE